MEEGRILIIDDSWVILERVKTSLSALGYEVRTTTETVGAAKHLRNCDLVIIDFHMPGMNGRSVLESLRKSLGTDQSCSFYLYTSDPEVAGHFTDYGFDGSFLRKGDEDALTPQVNAAFRTIRMRKLAKKMKADRGRA